MLNYATSNKTLGAGRLFLDLEDPVTLAHSGEVYMGDTPGFTVTVNVTKVEDYTSDGAMAEKDVDVVTKIVRTSKIQCKNVNSDNLALFVMGSKTSIAQTAVAVVGEAINAAKKDRYYQLGVTASNPSGTRNVTALTVTDDTTPTPVTYVLGTDYEADLALGRIHVLSGGAIVDGVTNLRVGYTPVAGSREQVASNALGARFGRLRFIAENTTGSNRDLVGPRVEISPNGNLDFKSRSTLMQMDFDVEFLVSGNLAAMYIDGRPA